MFSVEGSVRGFERAWVGDRGGSRIAYRLKCFALTLPGDVLHPLTERSTSSAASEAIVLALEHLLLEVQLGRVHHVQTDHRRRRRTKPSARR